MTEYPQSLNPLSVATGLVRETRPRQWYKQGIMFLGILFSKNLFNLDALVSLFAGVAAFTAVAGATYVANDIRDLESDRNHPQKQHRPIASGQVSVGSAAALLVFLLFLDLSPGTFWGFYSSYSSSHISARTFSTRWYSSASCSSISW